MRLAVGVFVPHTAVVAYTARARRRQRRRLAQAVTVAGTGGPPPFAYEPAVAFLTGRGIDEGTVRLGSIPEESMGVVAEAIARHAPDGPLRALQVGNFVGVSLAALTDVLVRRDPGSVVVSIDPGLPHLGVRDPQREALALLGEFGLQRNNVVVPGYSLGRSREGAACEDVLANLERLGQRFDVALIDGNHDAGYVRAELGVLVRLLNDGGLLVLDDVSPEYAGLRDLFQEVVGDGAWPLERVAGDARLGVLRKLAH